MLWGVPPAAMRWERYNPPQVGRELQERDEPLPRGLPGGYDVLVLPSQRRLPDRLASVGIDGGVGGLVDHVQRVADLDHHRVHADSPKHYVRGRAPTG